MRHLDRFYLETFYRLVLPVVKLAARYAPEWFVLRMADRASRRELAARYENETVRVGLLRRTAVDRFDHRSDAAWPWFYRMHVLRY